MIAWSNFIGFDGTRGQICQKNCLFLWDVLSILAEEPKFSGKRLFEIVKKTDKVFLDN